LPRHARPRLGGGGHAPTDEPRTVAHRARRGIALAPAEARGGLRVALAQLLARPRLAARGLGVGVVAKAQLERIDSELVGELVHRALEREGAATLARRALEGGRADVHLRHAMARRAVRARIERARGLRRRLREGPELR